MEKIQLKLINGLFEEDATALLRDLAKTLTHEVNNPLSVILGMTQEILDILDELPEHLEQKPKLLEYSQMVMTNAERIKDIISSLKKVEIPVKMNNVEVIETDKLIFSLLSDLEENVVSEGIHLTYEIIESHNKENPSDGEARKASDEEFKAEFNSNALGYVLQQIILNSVDAILEKYGKDSSDDNSSKNIDINLYCKKTPPENYIIPQYPNKSQKIAPETLKPSNNQTNEYVVIEVFDDGIGFPEEILSSLGKPLITTKNSGNTFSSSFLKVRNLGLGLYNCAIILTKFGGMLEIQSERNKFTRVKIYLPKYHKDEKDIQKIEDGNLSIEDFRF